MDLYLRFPHQNTVHTCLPIRAACQPVSFLLTPSSGFFLFSHNSKTNAVIYSKCNSSIRLLKTVSRYKIPNSSAADLHSRAAGFESRLGYRLPERTSFCSFTQSFPIDAAILFPQPFPSTSSSLPLLIVVP